jgi:ankyrin repeat protein
VEVARYLLEEGAQVNLRDPWDECSALHRACVRGSREVCSLLLAHGADATAVNESGSTPLVHASVHGHTDVVALLLAHGCGDIDLQRAGTRSTALHSAVYNGHAGVVRALLVAGADPRIVNHHGETPLAMAVTRGHTECVALLQVSTSIRGLHHVTGTLTFAVASKWASHDSDPSYRRGSPGTSCPRPAASAMPLPC